MSSTMHIGENIVRVAMGDSVSSSYVPRYGHGRTWVWNLVPNMKGRTSSADVYKQKGEGNLSELR
jgi:hypothetical protein